MRKHVLAAVAFALMGAAHASAQSTFWIDASALNVRNGPWGSIIGQVHYGQVYVELEVQGEWTKLWFDNREGWVYNAYTQYASQTAHRVTTSWLNVRSGPGTGYGIVGGAPGDSWWAVIGSDGAWRQINYGGGAYWVHGDYLSTSGGSSPAPAPAPPPPPPPAPSGAQFVYPVSGPLTSVYYTVRSYGYHSALDIADWEWAEIGAARSGTVNWTGWWGGYGHLTCIDHGAGYETWYAHQWEYAVSAGQWVSTGQTIGYEGSSGNSTGPHVHFEIRRWDTKLYIPGNAWDDVWKGSGIAEYYEGL